MLADDLVPQALKLEDCHHVPGVPQELNHLAMNPDPPTRCPSSRDGGADLAMERLGVYSSRRHDARQHVGRIEPHHRPLANRRRTSSDRRQLPRKRPAMSFGSDHNRDTHSPKRPAR
jgi:hypothetical protein